MRKIIVSLAAFVLLSFFAHAQTEKNNWLVGGNLQLNTAKSNTVVGLTPMAGKFIVNNFVVGGTFNLTYTKTGTDKQTQFGVGPFARYYFFTARLRPFIQADVNFESANSSGTGYSSTYNGTNYFLGGGAAYFINDNVALEALAGYDHYKYNGLDPTGGFKLSFGFQVYLHEREVAHLKGE